MGHTKQFGCIRNNIHEKNVKSEKTKITQLELILTHFDKMHLLKVSYFQSCFLSLCRIYTNIDRAHDKCEEFSIFLVLSNRY